jgi:cell fate regulator YaaT (PSP1 superfamily)
VIIAQTKKYLVRYGAIPEVARFKGPQDALIPRGRQVILRTHRGLQSGIVMGTVNVPIVPDDADAEDLDAWSIISECGSVESRQIEQLAREAKSAYLTWKQHIINWKLDLQLVDLEYTVDREKIILYVLNDRGAECTKLALQAATAGLGIVEVQPISAAGLAEQDKGGGCGTGGCGCSH